MERLGVLAGTVGEKSSLSRYLYAVSRETPVFRAISATLAPSLHIWRIELAVDMLIISFPGLLS